MADSPSSNQYHAPNADHIPDALISRRALYRHIERIAGMQVPQYDPDCITGDPVLRPDPKPADIYAHVLKAIANFESPDETTGWGGVEKLAEQRNMAFMVLTEELEAARLTVMRLERFLGSPDETSPKYRCGCGEWELPRNWVSLETASTIHRLSYPCFQKDSPEKATAQRECARGGCHILVSADESFCRAHK